MAGLFTDKNLNSYFINREAQYHLVSKLVGIDKQEYDQLETQIAQEMRLEKALEDCDKIL